MILRSRSTQGLLLVALGALAPMAGALASAESVIHSFQLNNPNDGANPQAALVVGPGGVLYGTTLNGGGDGVGTVFELIPPAAGSAAWAEHVLHSFSGPDDGHLPSAGLYQDAAGALYGTTQQGGGSGCSGVGCGVVFKLTPPASGIAWTRTILYRFMGGDDAAMPFGGLIADRAGNLYGTSGQGGGTGCGGTGCGTVFELTPPTGRGLWTSHVLHRFRGGSDGSGPQGGLVADAAGALYGTGTFGGDAGNDGLVFQLPPPVSGAAWTEHVLHRFEGGSDGSQPYAGLIADGSGNLYGTTVYGGIGCVEGPSGPNGCGTLFELTPPADAAAAWTYRRLYRFTGGADGANPYGAAYLDAAGALYATSSTGGSFTGGAALRLAPNGSGGWSRTILHQFGGGHDAYGPAAGLVADAGGTLYGTGASGGDGACGCGAVFKLAP